MGQVEVEEGRRNSNWSLGPVRVWRQGASWQCLGAQYQCSFGHSPKVVFSGQTFIWCFSASTCSSIIDEVYVCPDRIILNDFVLAHIIFLPYNNSF